MGLKKATRRGEAVLHAIATPPIWGLAPAVDLFTWGYGRGGSVFSTAGRETRSRSCCTAA